MCNNNFFQTPEATSYGAIIHSKINNHFYPLAHYCNCGGATHSAKTKNNNFQIRCNNCSCVGIANKVKQVAIYNWNASKLSQFPARIAVLPFEISHDAKFNPDMFLYEAQNAYTRLNEQSDDINPITQAASLYALKWITWLSSEYQFVGEEELFVKFNIFNKKLVALTDKKLTPEQISSFNVFKRTHSTLSQGKLYLAFLSVHCKELLKEITQIIEFPNRLVSKVA